MEGKTKALLLAVAAGGVYWQNVWVDHSRRVVVDSRLPKSFDGFTILHLSDLHFGPASFARRQTPFPEVRPPRPHCRHRRFAGPGRPGIAAGGGGLGEAGGEDGSSVPCPRQP